MRFTLHHTDSKARAGTIHTDHGQVETPAFMPVGTQGAVKALSHKELEELGARLILANTYHLYLRPGVEVLKTMGGLHRFMKWDRTILTDSGGYQVFSMADLRKISVEGVVFKSHIDGSTHFFSPEKVVDIQRIVGSDIMMVLDECTPYPCSEAYARESHRLTVRWASESRRAFQISAPLFGFGQSLFGIVQGSVFKDIRTESAHALVDMDFDGYAIGGLAVGEPIETMYEITEHCTDILPADKPRYLMGVGTPENLLESISHGVDIFDCVLPTRNGRNAMAFTRNGRVNLKNAGLKTESSPIDDRCECYTCRNFSRAYMRHLFHAKEILALQLASIHNLAFFFWLMRESRKEILKDNFDRWKHSMIDQMRNAVGEVIQ